LQLNRSGQRGQEVPFSEQNFSQNSPCPGAIHPSDMMSKETDELSPRTGAKKQTLSYTMKVSIKPPSTHTSNDVNIATAINNGSLSQSAQQANEP